MPIGHIDNLTLPLKFCLAAQLNSTYLKELTQGIKIFLPGTEVHFSLRKLENIVLSAPVYKERGYPSKRATLFFFVVFSRQPEPIRVDGVTYLRQTGQLFPL